MTSKNNEAKGPAKAGPKVVKGKPRNPQSESPNKTDKAADTKYSMSGGLVRFLRSNKIGLLATSYQSGRLYLISSNTKGGLMVNEQGFNKAMGLHVHDGSIYMATIAHIIRMSNNLRPGQWINQQYTHCYVAREIHVTGVLDAHDVGVTGDGTVVFVNTKYNCLATLSPEHSFKPIWKPDFITQIVAEDRCHLNGMAMLDGEPRYVTAVSRSNTVDGWRDRRDNGGVVIDVKTQEIVCEGLSMPHSPRCYRDKLWVLNSGTGELGWVDKDTKSFKPLAFCPGFVRGLDFHGKYAIVGLSRPRYERFEGLALDARLKEADSEPWTGLQIIDLDTGNVAHWFRIDGKVAEMYDVAVLPGVLCGKTIGFNTKEAWPLITVASNDFEKTDSESA